MSESPNVDPKNASNVDPAPSGSTVEPEPSGATVEDIRDSLECPVCYSVPSNSPIYQCHNGHLICKDCHAR
jgi:hypothetical protein